MPRCPASPYRNDRYSKYDSINGEYSCEVCPSPAMIISEIGSISSPGAPLLNTGEEESFIEYLQRGASSNDINMRNKYGDLLINLEQCGNYTEYGINTREGEARRNYSDLTNKTSVDTGKWTLLDGKTSEYLNICLTMGDPSQGDLSVTDNRICEIVNFYINTDGYLTDSDLDNAIMSQFGSPSTMRNNELERVLPPLPEELYPGGGNTLNAYKNFIHNGRGAYITSSILEWIRTQREDNLDPPGPDKILIEEIYEAWIELTNFKRDTPGASDVLDGLSIQSFFEGQPSSIEFEMCMNNIFDSELYNKYKDHDYNIQEKISKHTDITQLHPREIDYIEDKLKIIATLNPEDAMECMNILNIGEMICNKGVSDRMLKMGYLVMHIIGLDKMNLDEIQPGTRKYQKLKHILDRLTPYIRRAVKKIIEISKYYEKQTCGFESASTHILETIYDDVFEKTKEVDINIQGLDIIPTYLIKDTNMMEFTRTIILLIVIIAGIYVLMMILNRPIAVAPA